MTPSEIIEAWLIENTKVGRCNQAAEGIEHALATAGYVIAPKVATPEMIAAALPIVEGFQDEERAIGAAAVLLLSPAGRPYETIDARAIESATALASDYRRMVAEVAPLTPHDSQEGSNG